MTQGRASTSAVRTIDLSSPRGMGFLVDLEDTEAATLQSKLSGAASAAGAWLPDAI